MSVQFSTQTYVDEKRVYLLIPARDHFVAVVLQDVCRVLPGIGTLFIREKGLPIVPILLLSRVLGIETRGEQGVDHTHIKGFSSLPLGSFVTRLQHVVIAIRGRICMYREHTNLRLLAIFRVH